jgi:tripartite-type tricarboxylate transporter receptor subunit TctC
MKLSHRRHFLRLTAGAVALPAVLRIARADTYPSRPVHMIVGFAPGGGADIGARLVGQWLSERLGQPFVIENRSGAAGNIATEAVVRAAPDGYTLLFATISATVNVSLYENANFNFLRDIAPVAGVLSAPLAMVVNPSFSAKTVPEFIAYAKANRGKVNMAVAGSSTRVAGELFKMMSGVEMTPVQYRGGALALTDLMGGQVQVFFSPLPEPTELIRAGKVRALAVSTTARSEAFPDTPTIGEFVPGYEASAWNGIGSPRNTPVEIIDIINKQVNLGLADPKLKSRFADLGTAVFPGSPADFGKFVAADSEKWAKVVKFAGIKPE